MAFIGRGEVQSQASVGGGIAQHRAGVARSSGAFRIPTASFCGSPTLTLEHPPNLFSSSAVCSLGRDPFLNNKPIHLLV